MTTVRIELPPKLVPVFADDGDSGKARYRGAYGGRGSGKSFGFAKMAAIRGWERKLRILCARELQYTLRESSLAEIARTIASEPWLDAFYDCGESYIRGANGTEFIFRGLRHNIKEIKSLVGIDICWIEEAEQVSKESWRVLIPTIREPGSEIWATWNPESLDSATRERFIGSPPERAKVVELNWRDNPWFPPELEEERQYDLRGDPDMYAHIWEGQCITRSDAQVLAGKWRVDTFEPSPKWGGPYYGADWGFANDPSVLVRCWIHQRVLYVEYEAYGVRVDLNDHYQLFNAVPDSMHAVIRADSARPETISHLRAPERTTTGVKGHPGFRGLVAVKKWPGSVEEGIAYLRNFEAIVIHPRCMHAAEEARLWRYKVDRMTGDVLPVLIDANNHVWDAVRYALQPLIQRKTLLVA